MNELEIKEYLNNYGQKAKLAARSLGLLSAEEKDAILLKVADALIAHKDEILKANAEDIEAARARGISEPMIERLTLNDARIQGMAQGLCDLTHLPDPVGRILEKFERPNGLQITKITVPIGVIGIIYESRPNVTSDAFGICFKSGNACILRGGSEALRSNLAITKIIRAAIKTAGADENALGLIDNTSHEIASEMMRLTEYIDVLIPRGSKRLIQAVLRESRMPVIETGAGNCHTFVDENADLQMALDIAVNAKVQRPSVCNAMETLLVHESVASEFVPMVARKMTELGVEIRVCSLCVPILTHANDIIESSKIPFTVATDEDWETEYNALILAIKIVPDLDSAIEHISKYTTHHSEAIVTKSEENARRFQAEIDAACVYVNASTRFTDGGEFGMGAEIGISTGKIHARGPMGLGELTTYKYLVNGQGQVRK